MAADSNIYNALLQPAKSMNDYAEQYAAADDRRQQRAMNALMMSEKQQSLQDMQNLRGFMATSPDLTSPEAQATLYRTAPTQAGGILQGQAQIRKENAQAAQAQAAAKKSEYETSRQQLEHSFQALGAASNPEAAKAELINGVKKGVWSMDYATQQLQSIPTDPAQYQEWRKNMLFQVVSAKDQLAQHLAERKFTQDASNDLILPGGKINQPLLDAKKQVATAGAASVSVNTGQKGLDNELKIKNDFRQEPIYKAHQEMQSAYGQISEALKKANPVGDLAAATKIMKLLDPGSVVRESELGMAMAANGMLDRLTNYGSMLISGEKLTPKQRAEFQQLADTLYQQSVNLYNAKHGEYSQLAGKYGIDPKSTLGAPISAAKSGGKTVVRTGTDASGKKVVQYSDGSIEHAEH